MVVYRGDVYYAELSGTKGSEQGGVRPVVVIQNDIGNKFSPTIIVAALTSQLKKCKLPTHVDVSKDVEGLPKNSIVLLEQLRTIDKCRLKEKIYHMSPEEMEKVEHALLVSVGLAV